MSEFPLEYSITSLAFAGGKAWYTTSGGGGGSGDFGTINLTTYTTTRLLANTAGFHGLITDPLTGDLFGFAGDTIQQVDPGTGLILSTLVIPGESFDQGTTDGKGHILIASNGGNLTFVDYKSTGLVATASYSSSLFLASFLDDVAPLAGLGSNTPEPGTLVLLVSVGIAGAGILSRRRKK